MIYGDYRCLFCSINLVHFRTPTVLFDVMAAEGGEILYDNVVAPGGVDLSALGGC